MSLATAGLWLTLFWLAIHALKYRSSRPKSILPISQHRRPAIEVTVKQLSLRLKTEAFNVFHDQLSTSLSPSNSGFSRQVLLKLYDLGSLLGVVGMLLGFCLLFLTVASLASEILLARRHHGVSTLTKRGMDYVSGGDATASNLPRINPIIPGLTVPFSHLPLILIALAISKIVHESGHAITAALHHIPMLSCGIAVTFIVPSAFVTLPAARLERLPLRDRLQILSGGCFHNVLFLGLLFFANWSGVGTLPTSILFKDTSAQGRLVVGVDHDSPLTTHLPVGTLITKIDDFSIASTSSDNPWDHYLLSPSSASVQGWCTSDSFLSNAPIDACSSFNGSHSCFVSVADETLQYKLDPVRIFTDSLPRCSSSSDCSSLSSCVVPRRDEQLVRISIMRNQRDVGMEDVVVWRGPKAEIWEQVRVGHLRPRIGLVPSHLPDLASSLFEYMKVVNLSLYIVNMLPITALDGYQVLAVLLQLFCSRISNDSDTIDLEAFSNTTQSYREGRVQKACRVFLNFLALFLAALCGLLGIITWAGN